MGSPAPKRPRREDKPRTRGGCWNCRSRRKRCDQGRPNCAECSRLELKCEGYGVRLKWDARLTTRGNRRGDSQLSLTTKDPVKSQREASMNDVNNEARTPVRKLSGLFSLGVEAELFGDCKSAERVSRSAITLNGPLIQHSHCGRPIHSDGS